MEIRQGKGHAGVVEHLSAIPEVLEAHTITGSGDLVLREIAERLGLTGWLSEHLVDSRSPALITHPLVELVLTEVLLLAQGWRDIDDADSLRDDPAFRLAVSSRKGNATGPGARREPSVR